MNTEDSPSDDEKRPDDPGDPKELPETAGTDPSAVDLAAEQVWPGYEDFPAESELVLPESGQESSFAAVTEEAPDPSSPPRKVRRRHSRVAIILFIISVAILTAATLIYFTNPLALVARSQAQQARPVRPWGSALPGEGSGEWCLRGDFLPGGQTTLSDKGAGGDILSDDGVYSLDLAVEQPGSYEWNVVDCQDPTAVFPQAAAWFVTTEENQIVSLIFDTNQREILPYAPIPFSANAIDGSTGFSVIGTFQDWNHDDPTARLERVSPGLFEQVRRFAKSGEYEAYFVSENGNLAIDAFGRTTEPVPFVFEIERNDAFVVFQVDEDRGQATVLYNMPPLMTELGFGGRHQTLGLALAAASLLLMFALLVRFLAIRARRLQVESGCPKCGEHELMRISRHTRERLSHLIGIPAYRYRCRNCTWEGTRISDEGLTISPGFASIEPGSGRRIA